MEKRTGQRKLGKLMAAAAAVVGLVGFGANQSDASLIIDVRAVGYNSGALPGGSTAKNVFGTAGGVVNLKIFAMIDDGTIGTANDNVQSIQGSLLSSTGGLLGNLQNGALTSPFNGSSSGVGSSNDYDGDTDLDLGGAQTTNIIPTGPQWQFRANSQTPVGGDGEIEIGSADFLIGADGVSTLLNFSRKASAGNANLPTAALWQENGTNKNPGTSLFGSGTPVQINAEGGVVPEPASLAVLGIAGLGLLARRRNA